MAVSQTTIAWINAHSNDVTDHLLRHLVGIRWLHARCERLPQVADTNMAYRVQSEFASAFLVGVDDECVLVTAGHRLTRLKESTSNDRRAIRCRLISGLHATESIATEIPLSLRDWHLDLEGEGADYAALLLTPDIVKSVTRAGTTPVPQHNWDRPLERTDIHVMIGFPKQERDWQETREGTTTTQSLRFGMLPIGLEQISVPDEYRRSIERFCARRLPQRSLYNGELLPLGDIDGVSGGPIFGLQLEEDHFRYQLVAIQSSWDEKGIVFGNYVAPFLQLIQREMRVTTC